MVRVKPRSIRLPDKAEPSGSTVPVPGRKFQVLSFAMEEAKGKI
jgi:hypothetical protein